MFFCYFFFQAEDGIRDYKVTGVQTCALPILMPKQVLATVSIQQCSLYPASYRQTVQQKYRTYYKIGRASCRERV